MGLFNRDSRPNRENWKPVGNTDGGDDVEAWELAAKRLGIEIVVGYPVPPTPGNASAEICAGLGMKGIYIRRTDAHRIIELQRLKLEVAKELSQ